MMVVAICYSAIVVRIVAAYPYVVVVPGNACRSQVVFDDPFHTMVVPTAACTGHVMMVPATFVMVSTTFGNAMVLPATRFTMLLHLQVPQLSFEGIR